MLGKKSSLAPVLAFLTENDVGLLTLFRNFACILLINPVFLCRNNDNNDDNVNNDGAAADHDDDDDDDCCFHEFGFRC